MARSGGGATVEGGLTLTLSTLMEGRRKAGGHAGVTGWHGTVRWTNPNTGRDISAVGYTIVLGDGRGWVRLQYVTTPYGRPSVVVDERIELETTPQPFGGERWWFVCPHTGALVYKLHQPYGADAFASRQAYRLGYRCQRESPHDRAFSRAWKLRDKIGGVRGRPLGSPVMKPKWMRWATFDREMAKLRAAESVTMGYGWAAVQGIKRRLGSA